MASVGLWEPTSSAVLPLMTLLVKFLLIAPLENRPFGVQAKAMEDKSNLVRGSPTSEAGLVLQAESEADRATNHSGTYANSLKVATLSGLSDSDPASRRVSSHPSFDQGSDTFASRTL